MPPSPALALATAVLALTGCSGSVSVGDGSSDEPPVVSREAVEAQARTELGKSVGREPEEVTCPGDLLGKVGQTMRCMLTDSGTTLGVTIEVTAVQGTDVAFDIDVDELP